MKTAAVLAVALFGLLAGPARAADCVKRGIAVFPKPGSVVPTNFRIIVEGIGEDQAKVAALVGRDLVLRAEDDRVSVRVQSGWKSVMDRTAVVLRPRAQLKPNRTYRLEFEETLPGVKLVNGDSASWDTGQGPDSKKPAWISQPAVSEGQYQLHDGQLTRFIKFRMALRDESPGYAVLTIRRARGGAPPQTYVVPISGTEAMVGHDGCSGGFSFEDGRAYKAQVQAFDVTGNAAPAVPTIEFQAPRQVNR